MLLSIIQKDNIKHPLITNLLYVDLILILIIPPLRHILNILI